MMWTQHVSRVARSLDCRMITLIVNVEGFQLLVRNADNDDLNAPNDPSCNSKVLTNRFIRQIQFDTVWEVRASSPIVAMP